MSDSNLTSKITNTADSITDEATNFSAASIGQRKTKFLSDSLKRNSNNGKISRIAGALTNASPNARSVVKSKRAAKKAAIEAKEKYNKLASTVADLQSQINELKNIVT